MRFPFACLANKRRKVVIRPGYNGYLPAENHKAFEHPYHSVAKSLRWFKDDPLIAPPGTKFFYSSYGYVLTSAAIEGASGQDFLSFMQDRVFDPLGMLDTVADVNEKIIPNRARWYFQTSEGSYRNSPYLDLSYKWAAGGFLSTAGIWRGLERLC